MAVFIPDSYFTKLAQIESNNQLYAKASTSSASGLFQFVRSTWEQFGGSWGSNSNQPFGGLKPSYQEQMAAARKLTDQNAAFLDRSGITVSPASLYAAHSLGAGAAAKVLGADQDAPLSSLVSRATINANSFLKGMTVADFWNWLTGKKGLSSNPFDGGGTGNGSGTFQCPHCGKPVRLGLDRG